MSGPRGEIRVLHVDDEPDFADMAATFLEGENDRLSVATATSAEEGLERLADGEVDCIVSDYDMPGMDGIEFLEAVREEYPDLPFVLFTGKGGEQVASEAITSGATDYLQKNSGTEQYALLANRIRNAVEQYRARQRAAELDRIRTLVSDVNQALVRASSREEVEQRVCEILTDSDPYRFAWIGEVDPESDRIEPRAAAGTDAGYLDEVTVTADDSETGQGPGGTAIRERRVAVSQNVANDPAFEPWREAAVERGFRAIAAVPIEYGDTLYGALGVYADRADAFDEAERELLADLGDDIGHALDSIEANEQLRAERERWTALFENAPRPVIAGEVRGGGDHHVVADVNDAFEEVFGFADGEVVGEDIAAVVDAIVPEDERASQQRFLERAAAGEPVETEVERTTAEGQREFLLDVIPHGVDETPADGWYAWYRDVTERKEREQRIQRQKLKIEALHEVATEIETCETAEAVYEMVVDAAESILEFDIAIVDEEQDGVLVPKAVSSELSAEQYYDETSVEAENNLAARAYRNGEPSLVRDVGTHDVAPADPEFRSALQVPVGGYGTFQAVAKTADAFDEDDLELAELLVAHGRARLAQLDRERQLRERTEELERQNERLDHFASIVSHDLQNPVNVAQGRLELAREECDSDHLEGVGSALDRMQALIEDLLTLAREGEAVRDLEPVRLSRLVEGCWSNVATEEAALAADIDAAILADPDRVQQLLENLFRNAVEHGGDDVTVTVGELGDGEGFYVEDDGPGIPEDDREQVFEHGYSTAEEGTGFGLAIVREIAQAHDWSIRVADGGAGGARFEITGVEFASE